MAGSLNPQPPSTDVGIDAYQVAGTGTAADGHKVAAVTVIDPATGLPQAAGGGGVASSVAINDGVITSQKVTVAAFHNADNQSLSGTAYGLLGGGVAQLLNTLGNLDRQRETGIDGIAAVGIATGTSQLGSQFTVTHAGNTTVGTTVFTPSAMRGYNRGYPWSIQVGSVLVLEPTPNSGPVPANQEAVVVTAVTGTTFTAATTKTHTGTFSISGLVYNQARDSTLPDGTSGGGIPAGSAYFWNGSLNGGVGGFEIERSAAGELDGATGAGTAVAAEYEWNGGGPITNTGAPSGLSYDRARSLQAKATVATTLNGATVAGATSIVLASVSGLQSGEQIRLDRNTGTDEAAYVGVLYVPGTLTVPLQSPLQYAHSNSITVEWDDFGVAGPGLNGFSCAGMGIEEEALYNPVDGKYYIERASTQDAMPAPNIVAESGVVLNAGGTFERERAAYADGLSIVGIPAEAEMQWNGTGFDRARTNLELIIAASGARTTTFTSADQLNVNGHWLHVILNVTAAGTGSVTLAVNGKDPASGAYYPLLTGTAVTTNGVNVYRIGPALTPAANSIVNDYIPRTFQVVVTANNANAVTYSVGAILGE